MHVCMYAMHIYRYVGACMSCMSYACMSCIMYACISCVYVCMHVYHVCMHVCQHPLETKAMQVEDHCHSARLADETDRIALWLWLTPQSWNHSLAVVPESLAFSPYVPPYTGTKPQESDIFLFRNSLPRSSFTNLELCFPHSHICLQEATDVMGKQAPCGSPHVLNESSFLPPPVKHQEEQYSYLHKWGHIRQDQVLGGLSTSPFQEPALTLTETMGP